MCIYCVNVCVSCFFPFLHSPLLLPSPFTPPLCPTQPTGAIYCDRALRINGFTGEGVQSGTVLVVKAHSATPRWITTKKIDFDSKVIRLCTCMYHYMLPCHCKKCHDHVTFCNIRLILQGISRALIAGYITLQPF